MAESQKDTIYIDIDDEITTIIDKLQGSSSKVVALVLPKRATALQSVVNMKLLKRASEQASKNLVLVTAESSLMPLAGMVGLYVASTPNSRPEIPASPIGVSDAEEQVDEIDLDDEIAPPITTATAGAIPVGDLAAGTLPLPPSPKSDSGVETLELDNTDLSEVAAASKPGKDKPAKKPKKDKKLAVPNFNKFRLVLILGVVLLVILGVGGYFAFSVLPKASINITTNASNVNANVDFTLSTKTTSLNQSSRIVPAKMVTSQKTLTGTAPATGQQNNGQKAHGQIIITTQECAPNLGSTPSLASGSGVASGGQTYITQDSAIFSSGKPKGSCIPYTSNSVDITAQKGGQTGNTNDNATFTVSGHSDYAATGSADGGADNIQTVVSQSDIDTAKGKITTDSSAQSDLQSQLQGLGLYAITSTYSTGTPATTMSANVGDQAANVTVTQTITYTMLGASNADIKTLVDNNIKKQINTADQGILNEGITQAGFKVAATTASGASMNLQTTGVVGPTLSTDTIASQAAGKKAGDIKSTVSANTGVTNVDVKLSPFWVNKAPKNTSKITVTIAKPTNGN